MHLHPLLPHPSCAPPSGLSVRAGARRDDDGSLALCYRIGDPGRQVRWPAVAGTGSADGLWQHTCCELFVAGAGRPEYLEWNLSPSGQWATYRFAAYRARAVDQGQPAWPPRIECAQDGDHWILTAQVASTGWPPAPWQLALSVVIETRDGALSYWALAHPQARPDFHHRDGFVLSLSEDC